MNGYDEKKRYNDMRELTEALEEDLTKFYGKGNKAAGTRARKGLQEIKKMAQEIRMEIQDIKNNEM